ncbi:MAG: folate-binding protein [Opitutaceae bacterium]|jgi:hypothetical protein|nr:folate-binding protein [Opitutaceae bacterium]
MLPENGINFSKNHPSGVASQRPSAWLKLSGVDAEGFIQGQCTQDVRRLVAGRTCWALWLTIKGRVLGETLVWREGAGEATVWWLWSAHTPGEALRQRLEEFIIADDVVVEDLSAAGGWEQVTLAGAAAQSWLRGRLGGIEPPAEGEWRALDDGYLFAGRRGQACIWEWLRPERGPLEPELAALGELRAEDLVRARLAAGVPAIPGEFGAADLPQEAGLEEVALSFTKGCYLGQEVMARLHAMGRVRRRLVRVAGAGAAPSAGAGLHDAAEGKRVGELRAAVDDVRGGWLGLAMVNLLGWDATRALKLGAETDVGAGWSVTVLDQPGAEGAR